VILILNHFVTADYDFDFKFRVILMHLNIAK